MTLNQLRYYQVVCKFNSISKASESLHVSQPAVSIAISNLESEFGMPFFNRDNRTLTITEAGLVFLSLTNELLSSVDSMYDRMRNLQSNISLLRLSIVPFAYSQMLQPLLQKYRLYSPTTQVRVFECNAQEAIQKVKTNLVDMALTVDSLDHPSFVEGLRLFKDPSVFVVGKTHHMANNLSCTFSDLAKESLIFTREDSHLTKQIKNRFQALGITPNVILYTAQSNIIESTLQNGHDGAIISAGLARQMKNVIPIPIQEPVEISHLLIWKRTTHLPPIASKFIKAVKYFYPDTTPY